MLTVENRHAIDPAAARTFDTDALRDNFQIRDVFVDGEHGLSLHCESGRWRDRRFARASARPDARRLYSASELHPTPAVFRAEGN